MSSKVVVGAVAVAVVQEILDMLSKSCGLHLFGKICKWGKSLGIEQKYWNFREKSWEGVSFDSANRSVLLLYSGICSTHIFALAGNLWPLRAPNFGHL